MNSLYYVNVKTFKMFLKLEQIFRHYSKYFNKIKNIDLKSFLFKKCKKINADHILTCHNLSCKIMKRYVIFRLRIFYKKDKNNNNKTCKIYDSKSMAMHFAFK